MSVWAAGSLLGALEAWGRSGAARVWEGLLQVKCRAWVCSPGERVGAGNIATWALLGPVVSDGGRRVERTGWVQVLIRSERQRLSVRIR